ncbi:MAG: FHA domain-containing protein [Anaerolineae bacterium]
MDQSIPLKGPVVRLGRAATEDVQLLDSRVSRRHALLEEVAGGWRLVDQGSSDGTRVNGLRLTAGEAHYLRDGDVLELGHSRLRYEGGRLWVPQGTRSAGGAASPGTPASSGLVWLGAGLVVALLLWLNRPGAAPPNQGPRVNAWATQRAVEATLTAQAPALPAPSTDTPAPSPTVRPTRTPRPPTPRPPIAGGPTLTTAPGEPSRTPIAFPSGTQPFVPSERLVLANHFAWHDNWDKGLASTVVVEQHFFQGRRSLDEVATALRYLDVFDGLYTYRVVHRVMPSAYQKLPRYAQQLRAKANTLGRRLL